MRLIFADNFETTMSQSRTSTPPQTPLLLNRCQCDILNALGTKEDISLRKLIRSMANQPLTTAQELALASEVKLQCELLALAKQVVVSKIGGSIVYRKRETILASVQIASHKHAQPRRQRHLTFPLTTMAVTAALALAACAQVSTTKTVRPYNSIQSISSSYPILSERIVQFAANSGEMHYRYCSGEECPGPTPKVLIHVAGRTSEELGEPPGRGRLQDSKSIKEAIGKFGRDAGTRLTLPNHAAAASEEASRRKSNALMPSVKVLSTTESLEKSANTANTGASIAVKATQAQKTAIALPLKDRLDTSMNANTKSLPIVSTEGAVKVAATGNSPTLRMDTSFSSYDGLISFENGSQNMDGLTKDLVAKMAPEAREADLVRLRGHAATEVLTDDHRKLAIGRSVAVKLEFMKNGVERTKIRILNPKNNDLIDATNRRAPANRSVEIYLDGKKKNIS